MNRIDILKREVALLREVKHPNIIELVDMYEDEKFLHLGKHPFGILTNYVFFSSKCKMISSDGAVYRWRVI